MQVKAFERYIPLRVKGHFIQVFTVFQSTPLGFPVNKGLTTLDKVTCRKGHTRQTERAGDSFPTSA